MNASSRRLRRDRSARALLLGLVSATLLAACGESDPASSRTNVPVSELPATVSVPVPDAPIADMETVEDLSEAVANRFVELADKIRRRDFGAARAWIDPGFVGHGLTGLAVAETRELPLAARATGYDVGTAPVVNAEGFLDSLAAWIGPWARVELVQWKVKGAEFQTGVPAWGRIKFKTTFMGEDEAGGPRSLVAWCYARVERIEGAWTLTALELTSLDAQEREAPLFTDVATSAGVAHSGIRFGQPGNDAFDWSGAAAGDVNGDGLWDVFVPSEPRNFLYMGRRSGPKEARLADFVDEAQERGLATPAGGTGAVFFDFDNDGDMDLALGDVGWEGGGNPLRLYANDGEGRYTSVGEELGFTGNTHAHSLVVFDADADGWLDVFVCNYGRVDVEPNNSWIQATNGTPNRFYRNLGGQGFREEAAERGLVDRAWTYAAAAADHDRDGDLDLYVANDYGVNQLWINDGRGHFVDAAESMGVQDLGNGMGATWGDLDADGVLDLYVSNMSSTAGNRILGRLGSQDETWGHLKKLAGGNTIFLSAEDDGPGFERGSKELGGTGGSWAWSAALADLDLDGRLDVYCCSGFVTGDTAADT